MIKIEVPATSANIGAGFDCLGLAVPLYNRVLVQKSDRLIIHTDKGIPTDGRNLVFRSMTAAFDKMRIPVILPEMWQENNIPTTSGLGSSAACIVAGIMAANALAGDCMKKDEILDLACSLDGHPDNVTPALFGGIAAASVEDGHVTAFFVPSPQAWRVALVTPDFSFSTKESRAVLPKRYTRADVIATLSHATATFAALCSNDPNRLRDVLRDCFHEPYRIPIIAGAQAVREGLEASGAYATYLSGAGPTVAAFVPEKFSFVPPPHWSLRILNVTTSGATAEIIDK